MDAHLGGVERDGKLLSAHAIEHPHVEYLVVRRDVGEFTHNASRHLPAFGVDDGSQDRRRSVERRERQADRPAGRWFMDEDSRTRARSGTGHGVRRRVEVDGVGEENNHASVGVNLGREAAGVPRTSVGRDAHPSNPPRHAIVEEDIGHAVDVARHQVRCHGREHHIAAVTADARLLAGAIRLRARVGDADPCRRAGGSVVHVDVRTRGHRSRRRHAGVGIVSDESGRRRKHQDRAVRAEIELRQPPFHRLIARRRGQRQALDAAGRHVDNEDVGAAVGVGGYEIGCLGNESGDAAVGADRGGVAVAVAAHPGGRPAQSGSTRPPPRSRGSSPT